MKTLRCIIAAVACQLPSCNDFQQDRILPKSISTEYEPWFWRP